MSRHSRRALRFLPGPTGLERLEQLQMLDGSSYMGAMLPDMMMSPSQPTSALPPMNFTVTGIGITIGGAMPSWTMSNPTAMSDPTAGYALSAPITAGPSSSASDSTAAASTTAPTPLMPLPPSYVPPTISVSTTPTMPVYDPAPVTITLPSMPNGFTPPPMTMTPPPMTMTPPMTNSSSSIPSSPNLPTTATPTLPDPSTAAPTPTSTDPTATDPSIGDPPPPAPSPAPDSPAGTPDASGGPQVTITGGLGTDGTGDVDVLTSSSYGDPTANGGNSNFGSSSYEVHITSTPDKVTCTVTEIHADNLYNSVPLNDANNKGSYLDQGSDSYKYTDTVTVDNDGTRTETYSVIAGANETVTIHDKGTSADKNFTFDNTLTSGLNYRDGLDPSGAESYKVDATKTQAPTVDETGPSNFHVNVGVTADQEYHDKGGAAVPAPSDSSAQTPADVLTTSDVEDLHYVDHSEGAGVRDQFIIDGNGTNHYGDADVTTTNADGSTSDVNTVDENRSAHTNLQDHGDTQSFSPNPADSSPTGGLLVTDVPYNATDIQDVSSNDHTVVQTGTDANNQALPRTSDATGSGDATETESGSYQNAPLSLNYDDPTSFSTHEVDPSPGATAAVMDVTVTSTPTTQQSGPVTSLALPITVMTSGQSADTGVAGGVVGNVLSSLAQAQTPTPAADPTAGITGSVTTTGTTGSVTTTTAQPATGTSTGMVLAAAPPAADPAPRQPTIYVNLDNDTTVVGIPEGTFKDQINYAKAKSNDYATQIATLKDQIDSLTVKIALYTTQVSASRPENKKADPAFEFKAGLKYERWMNEQGKFGFGAEANVDLVKLGKNILAWAAKKGVGVDKAELVFMSYQARLQSAQNLFEELNKKLTAVQNWKRWYDSQVRDLTTKNEQ